MKETGIVIDKPKCEELKIVRTPENIAAVAESLCEERHQHQFTVVLNNYTFHKDFGITPYKVQLVQELQPIGHPMRFRFAKWACYRLTEDANFCKNHLFR